MSGVHVPVYEVKQEVAEGSSIGAVWFQYIGVNVYGEDVSNDAVCGVVPCNGAFDVYGGPYVLAHGFSWNP